MSNLTTGAGLIAGWGGDGGCIDSSFITHQHVLHLHKEETRNAHPSTEEPEPLIQQSWPWGKITPVACA